MTEPPNYELRNLIGMAALPPFLRIDVPTDLLEPTLGDDLFESSAMLSIRRAQERGSIAEHLLDEILVVIDLARCEIEMTAQDAVRIGVIADIVAAQEDLAEQRASPLVAIEVPAVDEEHGFDGHSIQLVEHARRQPQMRPVVEREDDLGSAGGVGRVRRRGGSAMPTRLSGELAWCQ